MVTVCAMGSIGLMYAKGFQRLRKGLFFVIDRCPLVVLSRGLQGRVRGRGRGRYETHLGEQSRKIVNFPDEVRVS